MGRILISVVATITFLIGSVCSAKSSMEKCNAAASRHAKEMTTSIDEAMPAFTVLGFMAKVAKAVSKRLTRAFPGTSSTGQGCISACLEAERDSKNSEEDKAKAKDTWSACDGGTNTST